MTQTVAEVDPQSTGQAAPIDQFVPTGGRIVVGVDGSAASKQALRTAAAIAELTRASIEAVGVWEMPFSYGYPPAGTGVLTPKEDTEGMLAAVVREVFGANRPAELHTPVHFGSPARRILEQAEGASLIVLGSRGRGALTGLLLGSVSTKCAAAAKCPVLIVHEPTD